MNHKNKYIIILIFFLIILTSTYLACSKRDKNITNSVKEELIAKKISLESIKESYNDYIKLNNNSVLYIKEDNKYTEYAKVYGEIELALDTEYEIIDEYFKILNSEFYIKYDSFTKIDNLTKLTDEYKNYQNYIPYNENIILKSKAKLYVDDNNYYEVNGGEYKIIIKNDDYYGIEFNNRLVYLNKDDVIEVINTDDVPSEIADGISILNYHFVVSATNEKGELDECKQTICITDTMFEDHIKYLSDNDYYTVSMKDLELYLDGKINLPKKSVGITIDDGWYVARSIKILEKYQKLGTLFLIGSLASPTDYSSEYLEIHSHTWNMHGLSSGDDCPSIAGRGGILCFDRNSVLEDLKKSRESLNNTTYFCYPFYDYSDRVIELLKEAGFTMAFAGQTGQKAVVGSDKYKIPRYIIYNYTTMDDFINYIS